MDVLDWMHEEAQRINARLPGLVEEFKQHGMPVAVTNECDLDDDATLLVDDCQAKIGIQVCVDGMVPYVDNGDDIEYLSEPTSTVADAVTVIKYSQAYKLWHNLKG